MKGFKERRALPVRLVLIRAQAASGARLPDKAKTAPKTRDVKPRGR
jgi:hypothetical protein